MRFALLHILDERPHAPEFQTTLDALNSSTVAVVKGLGADAILTPSEQLPIRATLDAVRAADAVVVLGGEDVTPSLYGGPGRYPGSGHHVTHADTAHLMAIHTAIAHRIPLLGICRGLQLINVALGGTLIQDLGPDSSHRGGSVGLDDFQQTRIALSPGTDLHDDVTAEETVYCGHHQAIAELGIDLRIAARGEDGCVEAVVHEFAPVTGVQWHPEHPRTSRTQLSRLLLRLVRQHEESTAG